MNFRRSVLASVLSILGTMHAIAVDAEDGLTPQSLEEGLARVQATLGKNDVNADQHEWLLPYKNEFKNRPDPTKAETLSAVDGMWIVGRPFGQPEAFAFDTLMHWKRNVYDLDDKGNRVRQTRSQCSHNVTRHTLTLRGGEWRYTAIHLSNGVHEIVGGASSLGVVKWHSDGFELIGTTDVGRVYGAEGKMINGMAYGSFRFIRDGNVLRIKQRTQSYYPAHAPDGTIMASPDFSKPFGSLFEQEFESEPMTVSPLKAGADDAE